MKDATATWLVRDDKAIVDGISLSVFEIAGRIERDPMSIVKRLREERPAKLLAKAGFEFEFDAASEEESELLGLALSGVPLGKALLWCSASEGRPSAQELSEYLKDGDCRPAMHQARELGIWMSSSADLQDMMNLEETFPAEMTETAIEDLLAKFQPPTPSIILQYAQGELEIEEVVIGAIHQVSRSKTTRSGKRGTTHRRKSSYSRRNYPKRTYTKKRSSATGRSKSKSAMYAYFG